MMMEEGAAHNALRHATAGLVITRLAAPLHMTIGDVTTRDTPLGLVGGIVTAAPLFIVTNSGRAPHLNAASGQIALGAMGMTVLAAVMTHHHAE